MRNRETGHALLMLMVVLVLLGSVAGAVAIRLEIENASALHAQAREQTLWLARSCAARGIPLRYDIPVEGRTARVAVTVAVSGGDRRVSASAVLPGAGTARVNALLRADGTPRRWQESFEPESKR